MRPLQLWLAAAVIAAGIWTADAATANNAISGISPTSTSGNWATTVTFTGAGTGMLVSFSTDCSTVTPSTDMSSGSASFTLATAATYKVCLRDDGESDSVEQTGLSLTVTAGTSATAISDITGAGATSDSVSAGMTNLISFTGAGTGMLAIFTTGACSSVTPNVDMSGGGASFTLSAGSYKLCLRNNNEVDSVEQTNGALTVVAGTSGSIINAVDFGGTTSISEDTATTISFTFASSADSEIASFAITGQCSTTPPSVDISGGTGSFTLGTPGTYDLCLRANGGTDSVVQTGISLTVVVRTDADTLSSISPAAIQKGSATAITFSGSGSVPQSGDKGSFVLTGNCGSASPSTALSAGTVTFTINTVGTYDLCYRDVGGSDSVSQSTNSIKLLVTDTNPAVITAINPAIITVGVQTKIILTDAASGDKAQFAASGQCGAPGSVITTPDVSVGTDDSGDFTMSSTGTYSLCYRQSGNSDSVPQYLVSLSVVPATPASKVSALNPVSITVSTASMIIMSGAATGDLATFTTNADCSTTTPSTDVGSGSAAFTLGSVATYNLCYRSSGSVDSTKQTSGTLTVISATQANKVSALSPTNVQTNLATAITFTGSQDGDKASWTPSASGCSGVVPSTALSSQQGTFTLTGPGSYKLCYRERLGTDSVEQSDVTLVVTDTNPLQIASISPTTITAATATAITLVGYDSGDQADFALNSAGCGSVIVSTDVSSGTATFTLATVGTYYLCYDDSAAASAESVQQTQITLTVVSQTAVDKITGISPASITVSTSSRIYFTNYASGDLAIFVATGGCGSATPNVDVGTNGYADFSLSSTGNYDLCYRTSGSIDSVRQTNFGGGLLTVQAATSATLISAISPTSATENVATVVTFTGFSSGDKATFATTGNCASATPDVDVSSGSGTFTLTGGQGAYDLCYRASGGTDSVKETSVSMTALAASLATLVTQLNPADWIYVGNPSTITFGGSAQPNDFVDFTLQGQCSTIIPSTILDSETKAEYTITYTGIYDVCYRQAGRSDSIKQTTNSVQLSVIAGAGYGADPVAIYGGVKRDFTLPPGALTTLIQGPEMVLYGSTFEGGGPWEQWIGRMVVASKNSDHWIQIAVRKDLVEFNRTGRRDHDGPFESLEVTSGHGDFDSPRKLVEIRGRVFEVPFEFAEGQVIFRKMHRSHPLKFPMIGRARRECMDFAGRSLHFYVCSTPAEEYFGWQRHLSIQYAHLDLVVVEIRDSTAIEGLLPELWGLRPASAEFSGLANVSDAGGEQVASTKNLSEGMAWVGGEAPEDLQKSCEADSRSDSEGVILSV